MTLHNATPAIYSYDTNTSEAPIEFDRRVASYALIATTDRFANAGALSPPFPQAQVGLLRHLNIWKQAGDEQLDRYALVAERATNHLMVPPSSDHR
jgi:hypothetical protein